MEEPRGPEDGADGVSGLGLLLADGVGMAALLYLGTTLVAVTVAVTAIQRLRRIGVSGWLVDFAGLRDALHDQAPVCDGTLPVRLHVVYRRVHLALAPRRGAVSRRVDAGGCRAHPDITPCLASVDGKTRAWDDPAARLVAGRSVGDPADSDHSSSLSWRAVS